jgi:hypothetical protein
MMAVLTPYFATFSLYLLILKFRFPHTKNAKNLPHCSYPNSTVFQSTAISPIFCVGAVSITAEKLIPLLLVYHSPQAYPT